MRKLLTQGAATIGVLLVPFVVCLPMVLVVVGTKHLFDVPWRFNPGGWWAAPLWACVLLITIPLMDVAIGAMARLILLVGITPSEFVVSGIGGTVLLGVLVYLVLPSIPAAGFAALACWLLNLLGEAILPEDS